MLKLLFLDKTKKHDKIIKKEFVTDNKLTSEMNDINLDAFFLSTVMFTLTKFTYSKEILITKLIKNTDNKFIKTIIAKNINTNIKVKDYLNEINQLITENNEYESYFNKLKKTNDLTFPDFQYYYQKEDVSDLNIPESNFTIIIKENIKENVSIIQFIYNSSFYNMETIELFYNSLIKVSKDFMDENNENKLIKYISISKTNIKSVGEDIESNNFDSDELLTDLFGKTVKENEDKIALIAVDRSLTYSQLNQESNRVANALIKKGLKIEDPVIIQLKRTSKLIVCMWGVIKSGGTVILADYNDPSGRIEILKKDSNAKYLINEENIDFLFAEVDVNNPIIELKPSNLVFIFYTSGSTGHPKGVMQTHKSHSYNYKTFSFKHLKSGKVLAISPVTFVVFLMEMHFFIFNGLTIVFANEEETLNPIILTKLAEKTNPKHIFMPPSKLENFIKYKEFCKVLANIQTIFAGGEKLNKSLIKKIKKITNSDLYSTYGSTETGNGFANVKLITDENDINGGNPQFGILTIIVDIDGNLLPYGVVGELWVGGSGIAKGYLNNTELSNEKFIKINKIHFFKTGDLAKKDEKIGCTIIGRIDNQIKLRGVRIELAEIENNVPDNLGLEKIVVIIKKISNEDVLVLYFVTKEKLDDKKMNRLKKIIQSSLHDRLPYYMVPQLYINLKEFPLTRTGKIDIKKLSQIDNSGIVSNKIIPPSTALEREIYELCVNILGYDNFGVTNSLLSIGFTSLSIVKFINEIFNKYHVEILIKDVLKSNTNIKSVNKLILSSEKVETFKNEDDLSLNIFNSSSYQIQEYYELLPNQLMFYIDQEKNRNITFYNVPIIIEFDKDVKVNDIKNAVSKTFDCFSYLKSILIYHDEKLFLKRNDEDSIEINILEIDDIDEYLKDFIKPFELINQPLYRVNICQSDKNYLCININHIIMDGVSISSFIESLFSILNNKKPKKHISAFYLMQYEQKFIEQGEIEKQAIFYKDNILSNKDETTYLIDTYKKTDEIENIKFEISKNELKALSLKFKVTDSSFLLGIYLYAVSILSDDNNPLIATIVDSRGYNFAGTVGMFVKTLPLALHIQTKDELKIFFQKVHNLSLMVMSNTHYNLLKMDEDFSFTPDILYNFRGDHTSIKSKYNLKKFEIQEDAAQFGIILNVDSSEDDYLFTLKYDNSKYSKKIVTILSKTIQAIIENLKNKIESDELSTLELVNSEDKNLLINKLNDNFIDNNPKNKTVINLFEENVKKYPNNIVLVYKDEKWTYNQLNMMVNKLARHLINNRSIDEDNVFIPLFLDRSPFMIISIWAVIKTGCVYVPITPNYPTKRIKHILDDIKPDILLVDNNNYRYLDEVIVKCKNVNKSSVRIINVQKLFEDNLLENMDSNNLNTIIGVDDFIYVNYTSGSTGNPKGVVIKHKGVYNHCLWMKNEYNINYKDKILQKTTYTFADSMCETILPVLNNATIVIADEGGEKDPNYLINLINKENITIIHFVPSMLIAFLQTLKTYKKKNNLDKPLKTLRYIFAAGEPLNLNTVNEIKQLFKNTKIHNLYGPTETSIIVTYFDCNKDNLTTIPIGKSIANTTCYILDNNQKLLPKGAIGELYIGGIGLAVKYLNNTELTREKFISNPYQTNEQKKNNINDRMYKSGDLVRLNKDNELEYIGRKDFQVKIRGFRIELGEIENTLLFINEIEQAVVIVNDKNQLIAYYSSQEKINENIIMDRLFESLPEYMIPNHVQYLDKLPLNNFGKVDRNKLPKISIDKNNNYQKPVTELEISLVNIVSDLLLLDKNKVSVNDDLFYLGLDSIKIIQLINIIRSKIKSYIQVKGIFEEKTILNIANKMNKQEKINIIRENGLLKGNLLLSKIQKYFFYNIKIKNFKNPNYFNHQFILYLGNDIDELIVKKAINKLILAHNAFRINFDITKNNIRQYYNENLINNINLEEFNYVDNNHLLNMIMDAELSFNIYKKDKPLYKILLIKKYNNASYLYFTFHHLIVDAVSWRIIAQDLKNLVENIDSNIFELTSYRQWIKEIENYELNNEEKQYYLKLNKKVKRYNNCLDEIFNNEYRNDMSVLFSKSQTYDMLNKINNLYSTQISDLLLSALSLSLTKLIGEDEHYINLETHGREYLKNEIDVSNTMGWFTTFKPFKILSKESILDTVISNKEERKNTLDNAFGYEKLFDYTENNLPKVLFNYLGHLSDDKNEKFNFISINQLINTDFVNYTAEKYPDYDLENLGDNYMEFNGMVQEGKLIFRIEAKLDKEGLEIFANDYKKNLSNIISELSNINKQCLRSDTLQNNMGIENMQNNVNQQIFEFQKGNKRKKKIIFVHSAEGGAENYNQFSKLLNENIPFYAIDNYNLKNMSNPIGSIKDIAKIYINYMESADLINDNNFILGGWSFGGTIAFEMASQLEKMNKNPQQLLLFDALLNNGNFDDNKLDYSKKKPLEEYSNHIAKIIKNYTPTTVMTDCIYYHASIKDKNLPYSPELNGFKNYLKSVKEVWLNIDHYNMFLDEKTLKNIVKSLKQIE